MMAALTVEHRVRPLSDERLDTYVRRWAKSLLRLLHVDLIVDAAPGAFERPPGARLVVANHRSTVDILLMLHLFGGNLLARGDMADWPAIGVMAKRAGTLFVDRQDPASGAAAVQSMRDRMRRGITVCVFPEGTTHPGDEVREFQAGAFVAVAREKGTVTPAGIAYETDDAIYGDEPVGDHMKRLAKSPQIRVAVAVGTPFSVASGGVRGVAERAQSEVQALVRRARSRFEVKP
ncbi:MAG: lysophospholipid acyltransferase family protein [Polyangiaceae bacterium]